VAGAQRTALPGTRRETTTVDHQRTLAKLFGTATSAARSRRAIQKRYYRTIKDPVVVERDPPAHFEKSFSSAGAPRFCRSTVASNHNGS